MNITKRLVDEHKKILKLAEVLMEKAEKLKSDGKIEKRFFEEAVFFIRNYADKFHHAKEEDILFREMNKALGKGETYCNPIEQMLHEHNLGREFVKLLEEGVKEGNAVKVSENAEGYARLIQDHIFKEDGILYPISEETLDDKTKKEIMKEFSSADKKANQVEVKCLGIIREISKK